ncbi:MAG: hypothetical protein PHV16_04085, partial [Candidatus Nanoarchaeia archaeon]|nr:hypothetical protein [Candidatus Nanoarchaeia archaeon]
MLANKEDNDKPGVKRKKIGESGTETKKSDSLKIKINPNILKVVGIVLLLAILAFFLFIKFNQTDNVNDNIAAKVNGE